MQYTVAQLREILEDLDDDTIVVMVHAPRWPMAYDVAHVATSTEIVRNELPNITDKWRQEWKDMFGEDSEEYKSNLTRLARATEAELVERAVEGTDLAKHTYLYIGEGSHRGYANEFETKIFEFE
jgi:hypothetical protein